MTALLMGRKRRFVGKQLVEEKLGRIFLPASDQEQFDTGLLLRLRQEPAEDVGNAVVLAGFDLPLGDNQEAGFAGQGVGDLRLHGFYFLLCDWLAGLSPSPASGLK
jgi:hypothetical protein